MKVKSATLLVAPLAASAFQLPFNLPDIKFDFASLDLKNLPEIPSFNDVKSRVQSHIAIPDFVNKFIDQLGSSSLLTLHRELVSIESISGSENEVAAYLQDYLTSKNFTVELLPVDSALSGRYSVASGRHNVFAYPQGSSRQTRILITSHIDTVPPFIPYSATSKTIYGRGSCDAKGSVAAQIIAVEELIASKSLKENDISLLFVVGEETSGDGMRAFSALDLSWEAVIFGEPTELKLAVGHKGLVMLELKAEGKASHSGYPELGINANSNLIKALYRLDSLDFPASKLLGNTTLNIGHIDGGVAANVIPAHAKADISIRIAAGGTEKIRQIVEDAVAGIEGIQVDWDSSPSYDPVVLDHDIDGFETISLNYGTDVPNLKGDHKKYLYGPGSILVAHGDNEKVGISDLYSAVKGYKRLIKSILYPKKSAASRLALPSAAAIPEVVPEPVADDETTMLCSGTPMIDTETWSTLGNTIDPSGITEKIFSMTETDETIVPDVLTVTTVTTLTTETVTTPNEPVDVSLKAADVDSPEAKTATSQLSEEDLEILRQVGRAARF